MKANVEHFDSGACSLSLELSEAEIGALVIALKKLRSKDLGHFHYRSDFSRPGVGDIEISCAGETCDEYLQLDTSEAKR